MERPFVKYLNENFPKCITIAFKELLERKHLYQKVEIDISKIEETCKEIKSPIEVESSWGLP